MCFFYLSQKLCVQWFKSQTQILQVARVQRTIYHTRPRAHSNVTLAIFYKEILCDSVNKIRLGRDRIILVKVSNDSLSGHGAILLRFVRLICPYTLINIIVTLLHSRYCIDRSTEVKLRGCEICLIYSRNSLLVFDSIKNVGFSRLSFS